MRRVYGRRGQIKRPAVDAINQVSPIDMHTGRIAQPRAIGSGKLSVQADPSGKTRLDGLRQSGSTKLVFPRARRNDADVILVNTAGGITGGDAYDLDVTVRAGAALTLTTQAAERAYRAQRGEVGRVTTRLHVHKDACFHWLPQELILFNRCSLARSLHVDLEPGARFLMVEPVVFGRAAMDETLEDVYFQDRIKIMRSGTRLYMDAMTLTGAATAHLAKPAIAGGAGAMASVVFVDPQAAHHLTAVRAMLPGTAGASLLAEDTLVIRQLALDSFELRRSLIPVLEHLTQQTLPASWRL